MKIFFLPEEEKNAILLVFQYYDMIQPDLSSPARFRFQGGSTSVTNEEEEERMKEILVSNFGCNNGTCVLCNQKLRTYQLIVLEAI